MEVHKILFRRYFAINTKMYLLMIMTNVNKNCEKFFDGPFLIKSRSGLDFRENFPVDSTFVGLVRNINFRNTVSFT